MAIQADGMVDALFDEALDSCQVSKLARNDVLAMAKEIADDFSPDEIFGAVEIALMDWIDENG